MMQRTDNALRSCAGSELVTGAVVESLEGRRLLSAGPGYEQDPGQLGLVVIDAHVHDASVPGSGAFEGQAWELVTTDLPTEVDGSEAMAALPDRGSAAEASGAAQSPRLDFAVDFARTGTHYVWVRGWADANTADTVHVGLNGTLTADAIDFDRRRMQWARLTRDGTAAQFTVPAAGRHTLNLWMREDGLIVDRVLVTSDPDYVPSGAGPATSSRDSASISGTVWADLDGDGALDVGEPPMPGVTVYLDANNNAALDWTDADGDGEWDKGEGERWLPSAADDPATSEQNEAGGYRFEKLPGGEYVVRQIVGAGQQTYPSPEAGPVDMAKVLPAGIDPAHFGGAVDISGNRMIVGTLLQKGAFIFAWDGSGWVEEVRLYTSGIEGEAVAIEGDRAVVGGKAGAFVYVRQGSTWTLEAELSTTDPYAGYFGSALALDGDRILVGASGSHDRGSWTGSAFVFVKTSSGWVQEAKLLASDASDNDWFGNAVALSGDNAIIGAYRDDGAAQDAGSAYIFTRSGSTWVQQAKLVEAGDSYWFGYDVTIDGDTAIIGHMWDNPGGTHKAGSASVYTLEGGDWVRQAKLTGNAETNAGFGFSVAIRGDQLVVGAYTDTWGRGAVHTFVRDDGQWTQTARLTAPDAQDGDQFGRAVAFDGTRAAVGAAFDDDAGANAGSAYVLTGVFPTDAHVVSIAAGEQAGGYDFGSHRRPQALDLASASDTGSSQSDNITRLNNAGSGSRLAFTVGPVQAGDVVRLYSQPVGTTDAAPVQIGQATAVGGSVSIVTDGVTSLADGTYEITARIEDGLALWPASTPLIVAVDATAPVVTVDPLRTDRHRPAVGGSVSGSDGADLLVTIAGSDFAVVPDAQSRWHIPAGVVGPLSPSVYDVAARLADIAGNVGTDATADELEITAPSASISGTIWADLDNDGERDASELGIAGEGVYLDLDNDRRPDLDEPSVITDADGRYAFTGLPAGRYAVRRSPGSTFDLSSDPPAEQFYDLPQNYTQAMVLRESTGELFISQSGRRIERLDARTGQLLNPITFNLGGGEGTLYSYDGLDLSPDERWLAVGVNYESTSYVGLIDLASGQQHWVPLNIVSAYRAVDAVAFTSRGTVLAAPNGFVHEIDLQTLEAEPVGESISGTFGEYASASRDGSLVVFTRYLTGAGQYLIYDADTDSYHRLDVPSNQAWPKLAVSDSGDLVAVRFGDGLRVTDNRWRTLAEFPGADFGLFSPTGEALLLIDGSRLVGVYDTRTWQPIDDAADDVGLTISISNGSPMLHAWDEAATQLFRDLGSRYGVRPLTATPVVDLAVAQDQNDVSVGLTRHPASPPDLSGASDTGFSSTDNLTRWNNATRDSALSFTVGGVSAGDVVKLYARNATDPNATPVLLGQALADGESVVVTTDGSTALADGTYELTARIEDSFGLWAPSTALTVRIDTMTPSASVNALVTIDPTPPLTGTIDEPTAVVQVSFDLMNYYQATNLGNGTWRLADNVLPPLTVGTYTVYLRALDQAGNVANMTHPEALVVSERPRISISSPTVTEGDSGSTIVSFAFTPSVPFIDDVRVPWRYYYNRTASPLNDYAGSTSGYLYWSAGESHPQLVSYEVYGDHWPEPDEIFGVEFDSGSRLGTWDSANLRGLATIVDDDAETNTSRIEGVAWDDTDQSGTRSAGEARLPGVTVYLDDDGDGVLDWTDANANQAWDPGEGERWTVSAEDDPATPDIDETGSYQFDGLPAGNYVVRQIAPAGIVQTLPTAEDDTWAADNVRFGADYTGNQVTSISTSSWAAQPFTAQLSGSLDRVVATIGSSSSEAAYLTIRVVEWTGGAPGATVGSASFRPGWLSPFTPNTFDVSAAGITVEAGREYAVIFESDRTSTSYRVGLVRPAQPARHGFAALRGAYSGQTWETMVADKEVGLAVHVEPVTPRAHRVDLGADHRVGSIDFGQWPMPELAVSILNPNDGGYLRPATGFVYLAFTNPIDPTTISALDARFNGASGANVVTFRNDDGVTGMRFYTPPLEDGPVNFVIPEGALRDIYGQASPRIDITFTYDSVGPRVIDTSLQGGDVVPAGPLTVRLAFDEALDPTLLDLGDVLLIPVLKGRGTRPDAIEYDTVTRSAEIRFSSLGEGAYELRLAGRSYGFADLANNGLDGEVTTWPVSASSPSGNGAPGGDFIIPFAVDAGTRSLPATDGARPLGSLIFRGHDSDNHLHVGDEDAWTLDAIPGQPVVLTFTPTNAAAVLTVSALGRTWSSTVPGAPATAALPGAADMQFTVRGSVATDYEVRAELNAAVEVDDSDAAAPLPLGSSAWRLGAGTRWAARGRHDIGDIYPLDADQEQTRVSTRRISSSNPIGQEFTPTGTAINAAQFYLSATPDAAIRVRLREGSITGTVLAESDVQPVTSGWSLVRLPSTSVSPSQVYVLEVVNAGDPGTYITHALEYAADGGPYAGGRMVLNGSPSADGDLAFRVGTLLPEPEGDVYTLDLTGHAGRPLDVLYAGAGGSVTLVGPDGAILATGTSDPLGVAADNYDAGILGFVVPSDGIYTLRVQGAHEGEYTLVATASLAFDTEPNGAAGNPLRSLSPRQPVLGHLERGHSGLYAIRQTSGSSNYADLVELDPATGEVTRVVTAQANPGSGLAVDHVLAYQLVGPTVYRWDLATGERLDSLTLGVSESLSYRALGMYGKALLASATYNGNVYWFDQETGALLRTMEGAWPGESARDIAGAPERGSFFIGGGRYVTEVSTADGTTLRTIDLAPALGSGDNHVYLDGLAYADGRLYVSSTHSSSSPSIGPAKFIAIDPDTGELLGTFPSATPYWDLAGRTGDPMPDVPAVGDDAAEGGDRYRLTLTAGQRVELRLMSPLGALATGFRDNLKAAIILVGPDGMVAAVTAAGAEETVLSVVAVEAGDYTVQLLAEAGAGAYYLSATDPAPGVISAGFEFETDHTAVFAFNEDVGGSLSADDLRVVNLTTGQVLPPDALSLTVAPDGRSATWQYTGGSGILPDGNYTATLPGGSVEDLAGNPMAEDYTLDFFVLAGDADRDRDVDFFDFLKLRGNYGTSDKLFSDGDFDYDGDVDFFDFLILRGNYGVTLPPPGGGGSLFDDGEENGGM